MRTAPALLTGLLVALTLVACVPDDEPVRPNPSPTASPIFASDEEALAAAEAALTAYFGALDLIGADGGANPERLTEVASQDVVAHETASFEELQQAGGFTTGRRSFDTLTLQSANLVGESYAAAVTVYVCEDFSDTDVLAADGTSIVSPGRQLRWPLTVTFDFDPDDSMLLVSNVEDWTGDDFCAES